MKYNAPHIDLLRTSPVARVRELLRSGELEVKANGSALKPELLGTRIGDDGTVVITYEGYGDIGIAKIRVNEYDWQYDDGHNTDL